LVRDPERIIQGERVVWIGAQAAPSRNGLHNASIRKT
jgi:hypothetical protein